LTTNINDELPYESTGVHTNKPNLADVFEKDEVNGNIYFYIFYLYNNLKQFIQYVYIIIIYFKNIVVLDTKDLEPEVVEHGPTLGIY